MYYNCVKFHKNSISSLVGVALTRYMDGRTDGQGDSYIPSQTLFAGGIIKGYTEYSIILPQQVDKGFFLHQFGYIM